ESAEIVSLLRREAVGLSRGPGLPAPRCDRVRRVCALPDSRSHRDQTGGPGQRTCCQRILNRARIRKSQTDPRLQSRSSCLIPLPRSVLLEPLRYNVGEAVVPEVSPVDAAEPAVLKFLA